MFQQVVGTAVAYLDLDTSKFNTGLQTAWGQLKGIGDQSLDVGQKFQSVGQGLQTVGSNMTRSLTVPIAGAFAFATKKTMDFEEAMSNVKALSGATGEDFDALREKAIELGGSTKFTSKEVADAFGYMALAGWKTEDMIEGIAGVLDLAASSGMDLAQASDIVTDYLSAFGQEAGYSAHMADMMSYAQANTNTTTQMLGEAFGNSAALMHTAGQEMDTTIALLGMLANEGLKGSEAGTALSATMRDIYQKMSLVEDESKAAALAQDGLSSSTGNMNDLIGKQVIQIGKVLVPVSDANGKFRDMIDILADVEKATNGLESAEKTAALQQTFTSRSIKGMSILLTEGADKTRDFREELQQADGTANEISKTMLDNLAGSLTYLSSAIDNLLIQVGDRLAPYIRKFADWLTDITNKITSMSDEELDNMVNIGLWVAAAGPMLSILGKISSSIGSIIGLFGKFSGAGKMIETMTNGCHGFGSCVGDTAGKVGGLGKTFQTVGGIVGGVIKTISGIAAVIGGLVLAVKNFVDMWQNGWNAISTILEALGLALAAIGAIILGAPAAVAAAVAGIVFVISQLAIVIHDNWDAIKQWGIDLIESIKEGWQNFKDWLANLWDGIVEFFEGIGEGISNAFNNAVDWIKEKWNTFVEWWQGLGESIKEVWDNICGFLFGGIEHALSDIRGAINMWFNEHFGSSGLFSGIPAIIQTGLGMIVGFVQTHVHLVHDILSGLFNILVDLFTGNFDKLVEDLKTLIFNVTSDLSDLALDVYDFFVTVFNTVKEFFGNIWDHVTEFFGNIWDKVTGFFSDLWKNLTETFSKIWDHIKEFFDNIWGTITDWFDKLVSGVKEFFENLKNNIVDKFNELKEAIYNAFEKVKEVVMKVIDAIKEAFDNFVSFIRETIDNIKEVMDNAIEFLKNLIHDVIESIKTFFTNVINTIKDLWDKVTTFIKDVFENITSFLEDALGKLWDWVKEFPKKFFDIGKDILSNLWEGLKSIWTKVGSWLEDKFGWISDTIQSIKNAFSGITSMLPGHANGLDYVPYDNYVARLHKGERVLTKQENEQYSRGNYGSGGDTFNFYNTQPDPYEYARQMKRAKKELLYS